jgi:threonine dehydratase
MLTLSDVLAAQQTVAHHVWRTPLVPSVALSRLTGGTICLKLECWQRTGSFKVRGALNKLSALSPDVRAQGVVTASAGNHGLGVADAGQILGMSSVVVFVPLDAPTSKVERLAGYTCEVRLAGTDYDAAHVLADAYAQERGSVYISAYDDPVVIAGQATAVLELMEALPDVDTLLVPVGGGGLIAGAAVVAKAVNPAVSIIGVQPEASPAAQLSLRDGRPYETYEAAPTICDGLAGGFGRVPFEMAAELIDDVLVVPEEAVRQSVGWLVSHEQMVVEGAGAIAIAPLLTGQLEAAHRTVAAILTGRNLDASLLREILSEYGEP